MKKKFFLFLFPILLFFALITGCEKADEILGLQICSIHNLSFYLWLVREARKHILEGDFVTWKESTIKKVTRRL